MKFIKLTKNFEYVKETVIYVNTAHITTFFENGDNDEEETVIKLIGEDEPIIVSESPDEVMRRIQFAKTV